MDVDEAILHELGSRGHISPKELEEACSSRGISRPTYFRHKKKLKKLRQIEEIKIIDENGKSVKKFKYISPNELATQRDIELYLSEIDNPDEEIRERGLHFFYLLSRQKRVAWYFSPEFSPKFEKYRDVKEFFRNKLLKDPANARLKFLKALEHIIKLEPNFSLWRMYLTKSCKKILEEIAWKEENIQVRKQAIKVLGLIRDISLLDLGFHILKEPIGNGDFNAIFPILKEILIESGEAESKKHIIREKLDELSTKTDILKTRVRELLKEAPP